jgi:chemotaxis protein MotB
VAVLKAMVDVGVDPSRLSALGNAQYSPLTPNTDEAARVKNRRVDIVILYPGDGSTPDSPTVAPSFPS